MAVTAAETDLSRHPITLFAEWMDAGAPGTDDPGSAIVVAGWHVPLAVVEAWQEGRPSHSWRDRFKASKARRRELRLIEREEARQRRAERTRSDVAWDVVEIAWKVLCFAIVAVILWTLLWGFVLAGLGLL